MTATEAGATLQGLTRAKARMNGLLLRVLRHAETVETDPDTGATTTANWWAHTTNTTRAEANRTMRLAKAMEQHESVRDGLATGELLADQAGVIVDAVDKLPDDVDAWVPPAARTYLLEQAADHDAKALRILGRRLLEVIDPAAADAEEARRLEAEEADARAAASATIVDDGHGTCHGRFTIPSLHGQIIKKHLHTIATNRRPAGNTEGESKSKYTSEPPLSRHRMGLAFFDYLETRPADSLPHAGGIPATILVTLDLDTLMGGLTARLFSAATVPSWTSAANAACTPRPNASTWDYGTKAAPRTAAIPHQASATPTMTFLGPREGRPRSRTGGCSAPRTTDASTTRPTNTISTNTARSDSADETRGVRWSPRHPRGKERES